MKANDIQYSRCSWVLRFNEDSVLWGERLVALCVVFLSIQWPLVTGWSWSGVGGCGWSCGRLLQRGSCAKLFRVNPLPFGDWPDTPTLFLQFSLHLYIKRNETLFSLLYAYHDILCVILTAWKSQLFWKMKIACEYLVGNICRPNFPI